MSAGVTVLGGPTAISEGLVSPAHAAADLRTEYGDMTITVEVRRYGVWVMASAPQCHGNMRA